MPGTSSTAVSPVRQDISARVERLLASIPTGLYIDGEWREASAGRRLQVVNPAHGAVLAEVADGSTDDALLALTAADDAQAEWASTPPRSRADLLRAAFECIVDHTEELAHTITLEMGKTLAESRAEVAYAAEFFRWFADQAIAVHGDYGPSPDGSYRIVTTHRPVGPCLLITPWNFPLAMATRKLGAAMAAGCTCVIKPAAQTPLTTQLLTGYLHDIGVPRGVINVVNTSQPAALSSTLMADSRLRKVSFTGSTAVGRRLLEQASRHILRSSMELGGNAPFLVFDDADLDAAVAGAMVAKFRNGGASCVAANRIIVQRGVAREFADRFAQTALEQVVGDGLLDDTDLGPLIDAAQRDKAARLVNDAVSRGATIRSGAQPETLSGSFYPVTVLHDVSREADMWREEIFGPVAPIYTFDDVDEAIAMANDTEFGLVSYLFTSNQQRAIAVAERLESGMVGINRGLVSNPAAPFGGVKASGLGREGGHLGIDEYLETVYLALSV